MDLGELFNPMGAPLPGQQVLPQMAAGWDAFSQDPRNLAALLSIGGALAQPPQFGQTGFGAALGALGAGGESVRTGEALDIKKQEAESKATLREAQADRATDRAALAGGKAENEGLKLELRRAEGERRDEARKRSASGDFQKRYLTYKKQTEDANEKAAFNRRPPVPLLSYQEWAHQMDPEFAGQLNIPPPTAAPAGPTVAAPAAAGGRDPLEGRTATGPNGQKMIRRNGQWQPL